MPRFRGALKVYLLRFSALGKACDEKREIGYNIVRSDSQLLLIRLLHSGTASL
jgi:hypothetical protein